MMRETRIRRLPVLLSSLVALALAVLPLPALLESLRPDFLVVVVLYWSVESPRAGGLSLAEALAKAARYAADSVRRSGAQKSYATAAEFEVFERSLEARGA